MMKDEFANVCKIIKFPYGTGRSALFSKLDKLVLPALSPRIGYRNGAASLHSSGVHFVGHLVALSEEELLEIHGIGPKRLGEIKQFLHEQGLELNSPSRGWFIHRQRRLAARNGDIGFEEPDINGFFKPEITHCK